MIDATVPQNSHSPAPARPPFRLRLDGGFALALTFFFFSGAAGLLYQVVWTRKLVLLFGTTSYAVSTVLSVFFLGLALGSAWGGRLADRTARPLRVYAWLELGIAAWAVVFVLAIDLGESMVASALSGAGGSHGVGIQLRALLAAVFLLPPVTMMGATLPLLARHVSQVGGSTARRTGALYAVNTFGAVAGCALTGFVLIAAWGYTQTTLAGAAINAVIGVVALGLDRRRTHGALPDAPAAKEWHGRADPIARAALFAFALSGFCALALEVVWTRLLTVVFLGTTYSFTTMLTTVLAGIAIGGAAGALIAERIHARATIFGLVQLLTGAACVAMLGAFPGMPERLRELQSSGGYEWRAIVVAKFWMSFSALFVPTFLFGLSFPLALRTFAGGAQQLGRDVGRLYAWNTLGGVAGALAGGYVLIPSLGTQQSIVVLGLMMSGAGLALVMVDRGARSSTRAVAGVLGVSAMAGALIAAPADVSRALNESYLPKDHTVIRFAEGVEGTVVVSAPKEDAGGSGRVLWINAVQATASIEKGVKMNRFQGVLPFLFDRDIKRGLFMCFGSGITAGTIGMSPVERLDVVEISADVLASAPLFQADNFAVMDNPRIHPIVDDGRNYLMRTREKYDLITFEPMPLAIAGVSTFYTREYYELCRDHLTEGGLVSQWVPLHNGLDIETIRGLFATFLEIFPETTAWFINADVFLIGSNRPLQIDYAKVEQRLSANNALRKGLEAVYLPDAPELLSAFLMGKEGLARFAGDARVMTDDLPWAEFLAPRLIFKADVSAILKILAPLRESVMPLVTLPAGADGDLAGAALQRRGDAHRQDMIALETYYRAGPIMSEVDEEFRKSLAIDPDDANARYYLLEILLAKGQTYTRWAELDKALPLLEEARDLAPGRADVFLALGEAYDRAERPADALAAYRRSVELGGQSAMAIERSKGVEPPITK